jgi:hypothetical protein
MVAIEKAKGTKFEIWLELLLKYHDSKMSEEMLSIIKKDIFFNKLT